MKEEGTRNLLLFAISNLCIKHSLKSLLVDSLSEFVILQFINSLKDNLNAEVVLGTVTNVKEACAWLGYTYLFIRMKMNPLAYGIGWDEVYFRLSWSYIILNINS